MKTTPACFLVPCVLVGVVLGFLPRPVLAQYFTDNFESYAVGGSVAPNWTPYYNGAAVVGPATVSGSSGNILQISSQTNWAGYAFRAVSFAQEFRLEVDIFSTNGNGPIIDLWHGPGDSSPYYRMLTLLNGNFYQGDASKQQIGAPMTWTTGTWHHVAINYARASSAQSATLTYYFDGQLLGQVTTPGTTPWDTSTHYLALANNFSGTTYFDNVSITAIPEPAVGAGLAGVAVALAALWRRRRRDVVRAP
ncbi:MAG: PEP-CTERM sorting domain-containing protein [Candidatus Didemnitutus sp.]|nr:PEP-CTERM sorting domain-containing protein [Candidatus Didemnitutus sp.]